MKTLAQFINEATINYDIINDVKNLNSLEQISSCEDLNLLISEFIKQNKNNKCKLVTVAGEDYGKAYGTYTKHIDRFNPAEKYIFITHNKNIKDTDFYKIAVNENDRIIRSLLINKATDSARFFNENRTIPSYLFDSTSKQEVYKCPKDWEWLYMMLK